MKNHVLGGLVHKLSIAFIGEIHKIREKYIVRHFSIVWQWKNRAFWLKWDNNSDFFLIADQDLV